MCIYVFPVPHVALVDREPMILWFLFGYLMLMYEILTVCVGLSTERCHIVKVGRTTSYRPPRSETAPAY
jgi:hypothetical protein